MYSRIFSSLFSGSMRGHSDLILVFVNILCHKDKDGFDDRHWRVIADETGLSEERVKKAIADLENPDGESRSRNDDGRRIERIDPERNWGWRVINAKKYDGMRNTEDRREYMRKFMQDRRAKEKGIKPEQPVTLRNPPPEVTPAPASPPAASPDTGIMDLVIDIQTCRMEYTNLNTMAIENVLKDVPIEAARRGVKDFCRDECSAVNVNRTPLKLLAGYLNTAVSGKGKGGKKSKTPSMTLEDIRAMNTAGMPKE